MSQVNESVPLEDSTYRFPAIVTTVLKTFYFASTYRRHVQQVSFISWYVAIPAGEYGGNPTG
jgi:hypothetical protein